MSPWHLLWIVPLSADVGMFALALVVANRENDDWKDDVVRMNEEKKKDE